jgi:chorismate synthase
VTNLRVSTAGESHGPCELCVVEGIPAGLALAVTDIDRDLARRQLGYGRGGRMAIESDHARFVAGVRHGRTLGTPICVLVDNKDHQKWSVVMSPDELAGSPEPAFATVTVPRPGHADLSGVAKYGHDDIRNVLERASARETVGRVAAGAVCKRLLGEVGVVVRGRVVSIGEVSMSREADLTRPDSVDWQAVEASPVGCDDPDASVAMCEGIDGARQAGESLGGVFEVWCWGTCPGLGGYATTQDRLSGRLLQALGSIPAIKGVEIGSGFANARKRGSEVHDPLVMREVDGRRWISRDTNRAGGLEGGMSTGMPIVMRVAMKPIPTLTTPLPSVDIASLEPTPAHVERSDVTAVPAARVVGEAMVAQVIAGAYLEKFGGDSIDVLRAAVAGYESGLGERGLWRRS